MKKAVNKVKTRKGLVDMIILLGAIFILAIVFLLIRQAWSQIEQPLLNDGGLGQDNTSAEAVSSAGKVASGLDSMLIFLFFGMVVVVIVLSFMVRSHPLLFFAIVLILMFMIGLSAMFSNMHDSIASSEGLADSNVTMPATNLLFSNLPIVFTVLLIVVAIIFFAKRSSGGGFEA